MLRSLLLFTFSPPFEPRLPAAVAKPSHLSNSSFSSSHFCAFAFASFYFRPISLCPPFLILYFQWPIFAMFHLFLLLVLSLIIRARTCPLYLAALLFWFRERLFRFLSPSQRFFPILGHIRKCLPLLSPFCGGAASLLQDVYQNVTTILQPHQPYCRRKTLNSTDCTNTFLDKCCIFL